MTTKHSLIRPMLGLVAAAMLAYGAVAPLPAAAQSYPSKTIRLIVPFGTGTTSDVLSRVLATHMSKGLGQSIVVENITGAGGLTGTTQLVRAPKDGHTLAMVNNAHAINPYIYKDMPFDAMKDVTPVAVVGQTPLVLLVNPNLPVKDLKELVALAKARPDQFSYGSSGSGSALHLAAVLFTSEADIKVKHVPYRVSGQMMTDLIGGHVDIAFPSVLTAAGQVQAGKVKALGTTSTTRSTLLPNVPTLAEAGLPRYDFSGWLALIAPAGTPKAVVDRVNAELKTVMAQKEMQDELVRLDVTPLDHSTDFAARFFQAEMAKHGRLVKASGATLQ